MQGKPSQTTHKLLCRQSWGEEDVTFCGVDTKNWTVRWGIFEDIFVAEAGKPGLHGRLPEGRKGGSKPQAAMALQPWVGKGKSSGNAAPQWSLLAQRKNTVPHTTDSKRPAKPSPHRSVQRAVATSISPVPKTKAGLARHCCCQFSTLYDRKVHIHLM